MDGAGNLFITDTGNHRVRRVDAVTGVITTVAGNGTPGSSGDGGAATAASLNGPLRVALDAGGNLFIADTGNSRIRRVDAASGTISTFAGGGTPGFAGDGGPAATASLASPVDIAFDPAGNLHIADSFNQRVRRVDVATGVITTVSIVGVPGSMTAIAFDGYGNLYMADATRVRVRNGATGVITVLSGSASSGFAGDGGPASGGVFGGPTGLAVDAANNLFIADAFNQRIRLITGLRAQAIAFAPLSARFVDDPPFAVTATASSSLPVTVVSETPGTCAVAGATVSTLAAGTCTLAASQAGDATYGPAPVARQSFDVVRRSQAITFAPLPNRILGSLPFVVSATASSGLPVGFASSSPGICSVVGDIVVVSALGTCTLLASQAGDATYAPAALVTRTFQVTRLPTLTTLAGPATAPLGTGSTFNAEVAGVGPAITGSVTFRDGPVDIAGCVNVALSAGQASCTVSSLAGGPHTISAAYSGDALYSASVSAGLSHIVLVNQELTVTKAGTGSGSVSSSPAGIACGATCSANFLEGTVVTLTPTPASGSVFSGWSGACTGTETCQVTMDLGKSVTATFSPPPGFPLTVAKAGGGSGVVTSTPGGIDCGATCSATFDSGATVALGAAPGVDSFFAGWSGGGCSGTGACNVTMSAAQNVTATFKLNTTIPRLANISTRMQVLTGADVLIGGFIIGGTQPKTVVVRARGPSLIPLGVPNALANPVLQLFAGAAVIASNDDWQASADAAVIQSSGFAPSDSRESVIRITLNSGAYTAIVTGKNGTTGVGIIEVFAQ